MEDIKLIPPFRFAIVEEGLFRGGYPNVKNFRFLQRLKLKTMISIIKKVSKEVQTFCESEGISHLHYPSIGKLKDDDPVDPEVNIQIAEIIEICIEPSNFPIYLHCGDGANMTGLVIMCLRKLQNWNLSVTYGEFTRSEVKIPPKIPGWLWQGVRAVRHPTIKTRLLKGQDEQPKEEWREELVLDRGGEEVTDIGESIEEDHDDDHASADHGDDDHTEGGGSSGFGRFARSLEIDFSS